MKEQMEGQDRNLMAQMVPEEDMEGFVLKAQSIYTILGTILKKLSIRV